MREFFFLEWPYDEALAWMNAGFSAVQHHHDEVWLGCGSHKETVITCGRRIDPEHELDVSEHGSALIRYLDRGGGITAHEPGQLVLYPIFHLDHFSISPKDIVYLLEQIIIDFLAELGLSAERSPCGPGVYVGTKKIGFIGLRIKERIVSHGLAVNVINDAQIFNQFVPCGMPGQLITTAAHHIKLETELLNLSHRLVKHFWSNFSYV